ncbi:MAG: S-layer homology domain-containing protein [Oscillospiraceae bacterium]|nr:S-layer homology domain-containing protein [Oscillospiraceae bacterium]
MKKRVLSLLLALVLAILLLPAVSVFAADYGLYICGTQVTDANCKDILGDGVFSFDPKTNTLTVAGDCEFNGTSTQNIIQTGYTNNALDALTIYVAKDSFLKSERTAFYFRNVNVTITGPGRLTVHLNEDSSSIWLLGATSLTIKDADLTIDDGWWAIHGASDDGEKSVKIINSNVYLKSSSEDAHAIGEVGSITLTDSVLLVPSDGQIKDGGIFQADGVTFAPEVRIVPANPFEDVFNDDYYSDPVIWAVTHNPQITNGTGPKTFSPTAPCTRGQVVAFLWRANGCPEPKSLENPFKDVKASDYYFKAVLWAKENDITTGTSATTFSPNAPCTRAHVVTFLWRAEGKPDPAPTDSPFMDVHKDAYYAAAVRWAVSHDPQITNGTGQYTFSPEGTCTRGQIVTFLYRAMAE